MMRVHGNLTWDGSALDAQKMKRLKSKENSVFSTAALDKQNGSKKRRQLGGTKSLAMANLENEEVDAEEEELYSTARKIEGFKFDAADTTTVDDVLDKTLTTLVTTPGTAESECQWSVHDNPIATGYTSSYKHDAGSDEEEAVNPKPLALNDRFLLYANTDDNDEGINPKPSDKSTGSIENCDVISSCSSPSSVADIMDQESVTSELSTSCKVFFPSDESQSGVKLKDYENADEFTGLTLEYCITKEEYFSGSGTVDRELKLQQSSETRTPGERTEGEVEGSLDVVLRKTQVSSSRVVDPVSKSRRGFPSFCRSLFLVGSLLLALALPFVIMIVLELVESSARRKFYYVPT